MAETSKEDKLSVAESFTAESGQVSDTNLPGNLRIRPFRLEIVPPSSGVQFYRNGIIFLAHSKLEEKVPDRHLSFGSIRTYSTEIRDSVPGTLIPVYLNSAALFPCEATTFSSDFNTMYFSLIPAKSNSEKIFKAEFKNAEWNIEEKPLEICNENFIYSHPCLSSDGTFMIFSSDVAGTIGGLDLWLTRMDGGKWSTPVNLGNKINSSGNELFASLDSDNNLFFSSDGHPGKGGYDIFVARYNGSGWDKPIVIPGTINSTGDELAFTINKTDNSTAFYTTRTRSGRYRTQLYQIDINQSESDRDTQNLSEMFLAALKTTGSNQPDDAVEIKSFSQIKPEAALSSIQIQASGKSEANKEASHSDILTQTSQSPDIKKDVVSTKQPATTSTAQIATKETASVPEPFQDSPTTGVKKDEVVYRVQIIANTKPAGSQNIVVAGKHFKSFEYLYKGGYRTTIGEFNTLAEATKLQSICRQNGYSQAFVVAFKNNVRSTDPELFK